MKSKGLIELNFDRLRSAGIPTKVNPVSIHKQTDLLIIRPGKSHPRRVLRDPETGS